MKKKLKVLHLPTSVGGNPQGISKFMNKLGLNSETLIFKKTIFNYQADKIIQKRNHSRVIAEIKRFLYLKYVFDYDVIFFNYGTTLFHQYPSDGFASESYLARSLFTIFRFYMFLMQRIEIFLLKIFNRKLIIQYQGGDARQGAFQKANFLISIADNVDDSVYSKESDKAKQDQIKFLTNKCDLVYSLNPDIMHVLPKKTKFLPYSSIDLDEWKPIYIKKSAQKLKIGHAPSNRSSKGTELIIKSLNKLKKEGFDFELVLIENLSNQKARTLYESVDVLIDQLYSGWYGGISVELMALGKPIMVYLRESDFRFIPKQMVRDFPFLRINVNTIENDLKSLLTMNRDKLLEIGYKSRIYVEKWHDPRKVVRKINNDIYKLFR